MYIYVYMYVPLFPSPLPRENFVLKLDLGPKPLSCHPFRALEPLHAFDSSPSSDHKAHDIDVGCSHRRAQVTDPNTPRHTPNPHPTQARGKETQRKKPVRLHTYTLPRMPPPRKAPLMSPGCESKIHMDVDNLKTRGPEKLGCLTFKAQELIGRMSVNRGFEGREGHDSRISVWGDSKPSIHIIRCGLSHPRTCLGI